MNAYELANHLAFENIINDDSSELILKAIDMLRQQADRIAELEGEVSHLKHINKNWSISEGLALQRIAELEKDLHIIERHYDQLGKDVSSKPVAWMSPTRNNFVSKSTPSYAKRGTDNWIPLYTHPVKELTDEEIQEIWEGLFENEDDIVHIHNFARAIEAKVRGEK